MNRRDFLRRTLKLSAAGLLVPPFLRNTIGGPSLLEQAFADRDIAPFGGRVLVQINLSGGNDGLNTVVPINNPLYHELREDIHILPEEAIIIEPDVGLHPELAPLEQTYLDGKMAIIRDVGYPDMNLSHFRSTDIWFSASDSDEYVETGWLARYLETMFPSFPDILPESPFALQQALTHRIPLNGERAVTGVVVDNPDTFYNLVGAGYTGEWDDELPDTRGGEELAYLRALDMQTFAHAATIQAASNAGQNTVAYPATNLGGQLEIVARLISGNLQTPIFLTADFGFDTHADQAVAHGNLMASLGQSLHAFLTDLTNQGLDDRVLIITTSEFGRRVEQNGSFGTDHGTAAPHFAIGAQVLGGIYGRQPDLVNVDVNGNLIPQFDFRDIYATVLDDFFGANPAVVQNVLMGEFGSMGFLQPTTSVDPDDITAGRDRLFAPQPNPLGVGVAESVTLRFALSAPGEVRFDLHDAQGRRVARLPGGAFEAGRHAMSWRPEKLAAGTYFLRMQTSRGRAQTKLVAIP